MGRKEGIGREEGKDERWRKVEESACGVHMLLFRDQISCETIAIEPFSSHPHPLTPSI